MNKSENDMNPKEKKALDLKDLFENDFIKKNEIESDGSANAFDETERVQEDNFDHLSEK
jgi:hypothetical protein